MCSIWLACAHCLGSLGLFLILIPSCCPLHTSTSNRFTLLLLKFALYSLFLSPLICFVLTLSQSFVECYTSIAAAALPNAGLPVELRLALPAVPSSAMPGKYCKCNATGTCQNCACAKSGTGCTSCIPGLKNRCKNGGTRAPFQEQAKSTGLSANCRAIRYPASQPVLQSVHVNNSALPPRPMGISASQPATLGIASSATPGAEENISSVAAVGANSTDDHTTTTTGAAPSPASSVTRSASQPAVDLPAMQSACSSDEPSLHGVSLVVEGPTRVEDHTSSDSSVRNSDRAPVQMDGVQCPNIRNVYDEVVHWRKGFFKVPTGSVGKAFVRTIAGLL